MSENAQILAVPNPAENPSKANVSDSSWQSDYDAVNGIQFALSCVNACCPESGWSPEEIDVDLRTMSNFCQIIAETGPLRDPYVSLSSREAAKLIAGLAEQLHAPYPQPISGSPQDLIVTNSNYIISACKDIDPSSAS